MGKHRKKVDYKVEWFTAGGTPQAIFKRKVIIRRRKQKQKSH